MSASSVMLSLPQMVDLSLNTPEVGVVNFNILHSVLHVIIQQIDLLECQVEFKGNDSERVQNLIATSKPGPSLNLTEYIVTPDKEQKRVVTKKKLKKIKKQLDDGHASKEEILVETEVKVKGDKDVTPSTSTPNLFSTSMHTVVVVEPMEASPQHVSVAISQAHFKTLEEDMEKVKDEIKELRDLPTNMGLIDALRNASVDKSSPVVDMFQILSILKRVEANEAGMHKLATMIEDLAKAEGAFAGIGDAAGMPYSESPETSAVLGETGKHPPKKPHTPASLEHRVATLEDEVARLSLKKGDYADSSMALSPEERLSELENKFKDCSEQVNSMDTIFTDQLDKIQAQLIDIEKELGEIVERIQSGFVGSGEGGGRTGESIHDVVSKQATMQEEIDNITSLAAKLLEEKEERQVVLDTMHEQIELLKTIKADREDLEDALADKADICAVNRKVSHEQFDAACDDLAQGIEDALSKLTQQEKLWQSALDEIQKEIENKLDKMELTPLRDFVTSKLKILQERLKALAALKKETEAAGSKSKFLRNVQCISCDKDVVMRKEMDTSLLPAKPGLPPTKSMAPYLAYELDALRKQQKCMPHSRNMNHFENAMSGARATHGEEDHICNRYCGGSHTVTTPQQRVTRLGHFLQQWGPDSQAAMETQIRGTDGQLYKSRDMGSITHAKPTHPEPDEQPDTHRSSKGRQSLSVQGDIVSARSSSVKPMVDQIPSTTKEVEIPATPTPPDVSKRASTASQGKARQRSITSATLGKRESTASGGRASLKAPGASATRVGSKHSQVSDKAPHGEGLDTTEEPKGEETHPQDVPEPSDSEPVATENNDEPTEE